MIFSHPFRYLRDKRIGWRLRRSPPTWLETIERGDEKAHIAHCFCGWSGKEWIDEKQAIGGYLAASKEEGFHLGREHRRASLW